MSDWHFGMDYDMWLYPPVDWTAPDELPEPIEAANIEGTLLVNAEDAIEQVHCLQAENDKLRELVRDMWEDYNDPRCEECHLKDTPTCADCPICAREASVLDRMRELGIEVDE